MENTNGVLLYHKTLENRTKSDILNLACNCYGHLVKGVVSFDAWAELIKINYDISDLRNKAIFEVVNSTEGTISNFPYTGETTMKYKIN